MFSLNVQAQKNEKCDVFVEVTFLNIKDMQSLFIGHSTNIGEDDIENYMNVYIYTLEASKDYRFTFTDEEVEKIFLLKTSNVCGNTLHVKVDLNENGSLVSFWKNDQYNHIHVNDTGY